MELLIGTKNLAVQRRWRGTLAPPQLAPSVSQFTSENGAKGTEGGESIVILRVTFLNLSEFSLAPFFSRRAQSEGDKGLTCSHRK